MSEQHDTIDALMAENRTFPPPESFKAEALVVGTFLYDEGLRFGTEYPISEKTLSGRLKQGQPVVDHLHRKWEQDKKKIQQ